MPSPTAPFFASLPRAPPPLLLPFAFPLSSSLTSSTIAFPSSSWSILHLTKSGASSALGFPLSAKSKYQCPINGGSRENGFKLTGSRSEEPRPSSLSLPSRMEPLQVQLRGEDDIRAAQFRLHTVKFTFHTCRPPPPTTFGAAVYAPSPRPPRLWAPYLGGDFTFGAGAATGDSDLGGQVAFTYGAGTGEASLARGGGFGPLQRRGDLGVSSPLPFPSSPWSILHLNTSGSAAFDPPVQCSSVTVLGQGRRLWAGAAFLGPFSAAATNVGALEKESHPPASIWRLPHLGREQGRPPCPGLSPPPWSNQPSRGRRGRQISSRQLLSASGPRLLGGAVPFSAGLRLNSAANPAAQLGPEQLGGGVAVRAGLHPTRAGVFARPSPSSPRPPLNWERSCHLRRDTNGGGG